MQERYNNPIFKVKMFLTREWVLTIMSAVSRVKVSWRHHNMKTRASFLKKHSTWQRLGRSLDTHLLCLHHMPNKSHTFPTYCLQLCFYYHPSNNLTKQAWLWNKSNVLHVTAVYTQRDKHHVNSLAITAFNSNVAIYHRSVSIKQHYSCDYFGQRC